MNAKLLFLAVGLIGLVPLARTLTARTPEAVETYYADGTVKTRTEVREGRPHGRCVRYYADGSTMAEGSVEDGEEHGAWTFYAPGGEIDEARSGLYEDGRRVSGS